MDSNDRDRADAARDELHRMLGEDELRDSILLVFANKQDLGGALSFQEIADILNLKGEAMEGHHWSIFGCSAVTGNGLQTGFEWLVNDISSRIFMMA